MSSSKRSRACEACHSIKIRCELGSNTSLTPPCQRCVRLKRDCVVSAPVRQKDKVAKLEAKVEALTRLLEAQGLDEFRPREGEASSGQDSRTAGIANKKRRLEDPGFDPGYATVSPDVDDRAPLSFDHIVSFEQQERILAKYRNEVTPNFPLVVVAQEESLHSLRATKPDLLLAIVYACSPGVLSEEIQEQVAQILMSSTATRVIGSAEQSLELVQVIQIICLWYRSPRHHKTVAVSQFISLAHGIAVDMGFGSLGAERNLNYPHLQWEGRAQPTDVRPEEQWRAWLVCHLLSSTMNLLLRRPVQQKWTSWNDDCLYFLEYSHSGTPSDRLLCQFVRAEHMCEQIAEELQFANSTIIHDVSSPDTKIRMHDVQSRIVDWSTQIAPDLRNSTVMFWQHVVTLYLHESVLHTQSNKKSFAAPFVAERLSVTDFPAPILVQAEHVSSLQSLSYAGNALIDLASTTDILTLFVSPGLMLVTRIIYALYVLVKAYIATTAPGNTYGMVFPAATLQLDACFVKLTALAAGIRNIDDRTAPARLMSAVVRMEEWYAGYTTSLNSIPVLSGLQDLEFTGNDGRSGDLPEQQLSGPPNSLDAVNWDDFLLLPDGYVEDFGLEGLFEV